MSEARRIYVGGNQGRGDPLAFPPLRRFRVEYEFDGVPFVWTGLARNEQAAIRCAAHDLAVACPDADAQEIRATSCIQVSA